MINVNDLLAELKRGLRNVYGGRMRRIYLYGSYASGDQRPDSVNIRIVLDRIHSYGEEILRTEALISDVSLHYGVSVSRVFVSEQDWASLDSPFLDSVRGEVIAA